jgi:hypothetical protein
MTRYCIGTISSAGPISAVIKSTTLSIYFLHENNVTYESSKIFLGKFVSPDIKTKPSKTTKFTITSTFDIMDEDNFNEVFPFFFFIAASHHFHHHHLVLISSAKKFICILVFGW